MNAWKEKVSDKLSRLLADSSSSLPSNLGNDSPIAPSDTETTTATVKPSSKEEPYASEKSVSSYLYSLIPSVGLDVYKSSRRRRELKPFRSLSSKWKTKSFSTRDKQSDCKAEQISPRASKGISEEGESEPHVQERNSCDSVRKESTSQVSASYVSNLLGESSFISSDLYDFLQSSLPNIVRGCQWILLYSTLRDGISLRTLLRKSVGTPGLCLLIVGDMQGAVFGGLLECPLKPTAKRKYQGSNQTFVFTTIYDQPRLFRATGANRYYYLCLNDLLAFGGGGNFALCLDEDLLRGTSGPCDTFGNLCLAHSGEFELKNVELWGFTHASQYIT